MTKPWIVWARTGVFGSRWRIVLRTATRQQAIEQARNFRGEVAIRQWHEAKPAVGDFRVDGHGIVKPILRETPR